MRCFCLGFILYHSLTLKCSHSCIFVLHLKKNDDIGSYLANISTDKHTKKHSGEVRVGTVKKDSLTAT